MNKNFKPGAQGGFTLIELIVVIVILGILAATALPKFASLSGDARLASLNAAKGAINSATAIVHGKILVNPSAVTTGNTIPMENTDVAVSNGYPAASAAGIMAAAGLSANDYTIYTTGAGGAGTKRPQVAANSVAFVPKSIADTTTAEGCFVTYTQFVPATTGSTATAAIAPTASVTGTAATCE
jgi:MSHA pilin protein MshA